MNRILIYIIIAIILLGGVYFIFRPKPIELPGELQVVPPIPPELPEPVEPDILTKEGQENLNKDLNQFNIDLDELETTLVDDILNQIDKDLNILTF